MPRENGTAKNEYVETARKKKFRTEWPGLRDALPRKARVPLFYFNAVKEAKNDEVLLETRQATMSHRPGMLTFGGAWLTRGGVDRCYPQRWANRLIGKRAYRSMCVRS